MQYNKLDKESETESLDEQKANKENMKFMEKLGMRRHWYDGSQVKIAINLEEQAKDKAHDWLAKKGYPVELELLCRHVQLVA